ncbi:MAG: fimbria/pilus periplasmic chaperone [Neisseriaceae bacterium]|nr:fimbria/pilus periplasmic chaperone [Neisseriaceae bacterium]MBP6862942.1 fimbria/pilus periplasmic chaperone [Neisseriaceae bacterium]
MQKFWQYLGALALLLLITNQWAQAAVTIDRTRVIYEGDMRSVSVNLNNDNKELPFLAQSWLEDEQYQKITSPLVALPPLQRLEPGSRSVVRVSAMPDVSLLPQDRESLFYFNVREIPPKSQQANVLQLALHTKVKLFYRPQSIVLDKRVVWQQRLTFQKSGQLLTVENPTPFHIVMTGLASDFRARNGKDLAGFSGLMLAPFASEQIKLNTNVPSSFVLSYINDYGGHPELKFECDASERCVAKPDDAQD